MSEQISFAFAELSPDAARERRDAGICQAASHADSVTGCDWTQYAVEALKLFLREHHEPFLTEQFVAWAHHHGIKPPPDGRAWGSPISAARRAGLIMRVGTGPAATSNLSPKPLWQHSRAS